MSALDIVFRSIEHLVNILYLRKLGGSLPNDLLHVISSLLKRYEDDPMMVASLNVVINFRNAWAHSSSYDCKGVGVALDLINREIDQTNTTLGLLVATTKELLNRLPLSANSDAQLTVDTLEKEIGLKVDAKEFVPFNFVYSNSYQPRTIAEYKESPIELKGKTIKLLDGKHAGRLALFRRFNGSVAWIEFKDNAETIAVKLHRKIQIV